MNLLFYFNAVSFAAVLIFTAGGIHAPGVFWLTAVPLLGGVLLGRRGVILGVGIVIVTIAIYTFLNSRGIVINIINEKALYVQEKNANLTLFLLFSGIISYYFIRTEERAIKVITSQKIQIESLLRVLVHDLANTVTMISLRVGPIKKKLCKEGEVTDDFKKIQLALDNATDILTQIRQLKMLEDGKISLDKNPFNLAALADEVIELLEDKISQKNINVSKEFSFGESLACGDEQIFKTQILMNILSNAIKFSQNGGEIKLDGFEDENELVLTIKDHGIGIPKDILENIFSLNAVTSRKGTEGEAGSGYGMPLVKQFMEAHNGSISIDTSVGDSSGTEVKLAIPKSSVS